jgi:hypothetical protein
MRKPKTEIDAIQLHRTAMLKHVRSFPKLWEEKHFRDAVAHLWAAEAALTKPERAPGAFNPCDGHARD